MVSLRCRDEIEAEFRVRGILMPEISQGMVDFEDELTECQWVGLKEGLSDLGFEVLDDTESKLLDSISDLVDQLISQNRELSIMDYPEYLKKELGVNDPKLAKIFIQVYGIDLLQYIAVRQVERIKEMILYEDKEPSEIAALLRFESEAHMTHTFKNITGLLPVYYKRIKEKRLEVRKRNGFE
ncbi:Helix-turn-helix domain protein [compost metagenome]